MSVSHIAAPQSLAALQRQRLGSVYREVKIAHQVYLRQVDEALRKSLRRSVLRELRSLRREMAADKVRVIARAAEQGHGAFLPWGTQCFMRAVARYFEEERGTDRALRPPWRLFPNAERAELERLRDTLTRRFDEVRCAYVDATNDLKRRSEQWKHQVQ